MFWISSTNETWSIWKKMQIDCLTWLLSTETPSTEKFQKLSLVTEHASSTYDVISDRKSLCSLVIYGLAAITMSGGAYLGCFWNVSTHTLISEAIVTGYDVDERLRIDLISSSDKWEISIRWNG